VNPLQDLAHVRPELATRLEQPLKEAWPSDSALLVDYELGFGSKDVVVRLRYQAPKPLDPLVTEVLHKVLQSRLEVEALRLDMDWVKPEPAPKRSKNSHTLRGTNKR
jgi:hypothetical protein